MFLYYVIQPETGTMLWAVDIAGQKQYIQHYEAIGIKLLYGKLKVTTGYLDAKSVPV